MAFCFMDFTLIWTILAETNVVHISGIGCISFGGYVHVRYAFGGSMSVHCTHAITIVFLEILRQKVRVSRFRAQIRGALQV